MSTEERAIDLIFEEVKLAALSLGHSNQESTEIASSADERIRIRLGGSETYIHAAAKSRRNAEIFSKFKGDNYVQLAQEFGVSPRRIRQIVDDQFGGR